jgi:hypothetical protein
MDDTLYDYVLKAIRQWDIDKDSKDILDDDIRSDCTYAAEMFIEERKVTK